MFHLDLLKVRTNNNVQRIENCKQQVFDYLSEQRKP